MGPEDLAFVVAEHRTHFPEGFFARLGRRYLTAYTRTYVTSPHAVAYIAEADGRPVGFLVGVSNPPAHREHVMRTHGRALALRAAAALCVRPGLAVHFLRTRLGRYARKLRGGHQEPNAQQTGLATPPDGTTAVLAHVVIVERVRSYGLGSALVTRFVQDAAAAGCTQASLVTAAGPDGAGRYYEQLGWHCAGDVRTPEGRLLESYVFPLHNQPRGTAQ